MSDLPSGNAPSESAGREGSAVRLPSSTVEADVSSGVVSDCCGMVAAIGCVCGGRTVVFCWTTGCGVMSTVFTGVGNGLDGSWTAGVLGGGVSGLGGVMAAIFIDLGGVAGLV